MDSNNISQEAMELMLEESYHTIVEAFVNSGHLSSRDFLAKVFDSAFKLIPMAEKGSYYELQGDLFRPIFANGYDMQVLNRLAFTEDDLFIGFEVNDPGAIEVYEFYNEQRDDTLFTQETIETFKTLGTYNEFTSLYAPIQVDGANVGLICCERFDGKRYSKASRLILKLYAQLISNFYSQLLHREHERERYEEIINAMVSAIELKDKYTEGHGKRVTELATGLAIYMNLTEQQTTNISTAAILHDIGKIGIHSDILIKPAKLTEEEYNLIKEHPAFTKKILENIGDFAEVVEIAYKHHEYYNGKGYPEGISGAEIPIESAIISIVDAFDAMTTDRSYRKSLSEVEAYKILEACGGSQFNPEVVDAFLTWRHYEDY